MEVSSISCPSSDHALFPNVSCRHEMSFFLFFQFRDTELTLALFSNLLFLLLQFKHKLIYEPFGILWYLPRNQLYLQKDELLSGTPRRHQLLCSLSCSIYRFRIFYSRTSRRGTTAMFLLSGFVSTSSKKSDN
jgi:hypothetical protein